MNSHLAVFLGCLVLAQGLALGQAAPSGGVGVRLSDTVQRQPGYGTFVGGMLPGSPADLAGIKEGDQIASVDGQPVAGVSLETIEITPETKAAPGLNMKQVIAALHGAPGTSITIVVYRKDAAAPNSFYMSNRPLTDAEKELVRPYHRTSLTFTVTRAVLATTAKSAP